MNNCLTLIKLAQGKHGKLLTKCYIGQLIKRLLPEYFKKGGNEITDNVEITNYFNSCFTNIGRDLANKTKDDSNKKYSYYLTGHFEIRFKFQEINLESILKIIYNCPAKSSSGCDGTIL